MFVTNFKRYGRDVFELIFFIFQYIGSFPVDGVNHRDRSEFVRMKLEMNEVSLWYFLLICLFICNRYMFCLTVYHQLSNPNGYFVEWNQNLEWDRRRKLCFFYIYEFPKSSSGKIQHVLTKRSHCYQRRCAADVKHWSVSIPRRCDLFEEEPTFRSHFP